MVALDDVPDPVTALDAVGGDGPLHQVLGPVLLGGALEHPDEPLADYLPLRLRVGNALQSIEELIAGIDQAIVDAEGVNILATASVSPFLMKPLLIHGQQLVSYGT